MDDISNKPSIYEFNEELIAESIKTHISEEFKKIKEQNEIAQLNYAKQNESKLNELFEIMKNIFELQKSASVIQEKILANASENHQKTSTEIHIK